MKWNGMQIKKKNKIKYQNIFLIDFFCFMHFLAIIQYYIPIIQKMKRIEEKFKKMNP
jgi:hypothetical protein